MTEQLKQTPIGRHAYCKQYTVKLELCTSLAISVFFAVLTDFDTGYHCGQQYVKYSQYLAP